MVYVAVSLFGRELTVLPGRHVMGPDGVRAYLDEFVCLPVHKTTPFTASVVVNGHVIGAVGPELGGFTGLGL